MTIGHLAPVALIAAMVEQRWRSEWPRWTHTLPWVATLAGCVFPDLDIISNILLNGISRHLYYFPHSLLTYLPVLALGWLLLRWQRSRCIGLTVMAFGGGVLSHLLLDAISHGILLFYPLWNQVVGWTFPYTSESVLLIYLYSPWLELATVVAALAWWLTHRVHVRSAVRRKTLS